MICEGITREKRVEVYPLSLNLSAFQCLVHTSRLAEYILQDYSDEINTKNPLGMHVCGFFFFFLFVCFFIILFFYLNFFCFVLALY
ncbi:hypothetical protein Patl1_35900 [Pistacia atlantica]|nr:hypothetical protein Patl1_35900 [Pistacia atlantica]